MNDERATNQDSDPEQAEQTSESRREALARMGRFAGYTAPAMLTLLTSNADAQSFGGSNAGVPGHQQFSDLTNFFAFLSNLAQNFLNGRH